MLIHMYPTGGFWADDGSEREHCYKIAPRSIAQDVRQMRLHAFDLVYEALGKLGYRFRDAGHNHEKVVISLNKPINPKHLRRLESTFSIETDNGDELAFI